MNVWWFFIIFFFIFFLELEASKKQQEVDKKNIDDLVRERDILNKVSFLVIRMAGTMNSSAFINI